MKQLSLLAAGVSAATVLFGPLNTSALQCEVIFAEGPSILSILKVEVNSTHEDQKFCAEELGSAENLVDSLRGSLNNALQKILSEGLGDSQPTESRTKLLELQIFHEPIYNVAGRVVRNEIHMERLLSAWPTGWTEWKVMSIYGTDPLWKQEHPNVVRYKPDRTRFAELDDREFQKVVGSMREEHTKLGAAILDPAVPLAAAVAFDSRREGSGDACILTFESSDGDRLFTSSYPPLEVELHNATFWGSPSGISNFYSVYPKPSIVIRNEKVIQQFKRKWPRDWKQLSPSSMKSSPCEETYVISMDYPEDVDELTQFVRQLFKQKMSMLPRQPMSLDPAVPLEALRLGMAFARLDGKRNLFEHNEKHLMLLEKKLEKALENAKEVVADATARMEAAESEVKYLAKVVKMAKEDQKAAKRVQEQEEAKRVEEQQWPRKENIRRSGL